MEERRTRAHAHARRNTRQRQMVLDEVRSRCDHPTAEQIYEAVRARDPRVSQATVYRNLHLLAQEGQILSIKAPGVEHFDLRRDAHPHLVCVRCGSVVDVPLASDDPKLDASVANKTGWQVLDHQLIFRGVCPDCAAREAQAADADAGEKDEPSRQ
ncbi:MAG: transcriptional repressor [Olsenella sp.]|jgi:Fe2+ or Zn2+ uptake regulation protein|nr:transcriptional repressor [Olsenella sp.]MCI1289958.1 transcriptional repressor [Olsenella sp.]